MDFFAKISGIMIFTSVIVIAQNNIQVKDITISKSEPILSTGDLLAKVGSKIFYLDEFYRRVEYTIRPGYCKGN